ncbi:PLP-dependent aminotransferase family protein [Magnetofaba australis]|nr:PLP-dependent aminotransferase family protein [Magnetofaba australis]
MDISTNTDLDRDATPRYRQLADHILAGIDDGTYAPGDKLPSVRRLQRRLNLSAATVTSAYLTLEREGVVEARPRSGYFVARLEAKSKPPRRETLPTTPSRIAISPMARTVEASALDNRLAPLGAAVLDSSFLPIEQMAKNTRLLARTEMADALSYGPPNGARRLRRELARSQWGFPDPPGMEEIILTNGCMEAVSLCLRATTRPGDAVAVESPVFFGFLQMIENLGLYAMEVPTDPVTGMDPDGLARVLQDDRVRAVLTIPSFQNPTGALMPIENRQRICQMVTKRRIPLIEDNIYGDLHYGETRLPPIKHWDRDGWVLYCSSFSKTVGPGLRVGVTIPGPRFAERVTALKMGSTLTSAQFTQLALANFLEDGGYQRHLRKLRVALQENMRQLRQSIARHFPQGVRMTDPKGGFILWVELPAGGDGVSLYEAAVGEGIAIVPGSVCSPSGSWRRCIRVSAGSPWSERLENAVARLGELARGG